MGYVFVAAPCAVCRVPFTFNPLRVPSMRVGGEREPICRDCVERANISRRERGLPPFKPLPGAYEPCDEREL